MRADFAAISAEASFITAARPGSACSGHSAAGINDFMMALIGAMTSQQNAVSLQGDSTGHILPVIPVISGEGGDSQITLAAPENGQLSATLLSVLTLPVSQIQEINGAGVSSAAGTVTAPGSRIQEADLLLRQTAQTLDGGAEKLMVQPILMPKSETAGEKAAVSDNLKPMDCLMIQESPDGNGKHHGIERGMPSGPLASTGWSSGGSQELSRLSTQYSAAVSPEKIPAAFMPLNTELTARQVALNTAGGLPGMNAAVTESQTGENQGFGGQNTHGHDGKEDLLLSVRQAPVKEGGPPAAVSSQKAELPAGGPEVGNRHREAGDKNTFGKDSVHITTEKAEGEAGIKAGSVAAVPEENGSPDGRHITADGGKNREQVQVNAGHINIQNVTPKKFPSEIIPHFLSTVRNLGQESRITVIRLKLQPENLGEINIKLSYVKGELTAHFFTSSGLVKEAVESSLPQLKETLTQYNVDLGEAAAFVGQEQQGHKGTGYTGSGQNGSGKVNFDLAAGDLKGADSGETGRTGSGGADRLLNLLV